MRKGTDTLERLRGGVTASGATKTRGAYHPSLADATISRGDKGAPNQTHASPVMRSPLRPPPPLGAHARGGYDWIPESNRGVLKHAGDSLGKDLPAHMQKAAGPAHQRLAHEVASGLRKFSFGQVRRLQPAGT